MNSRLRQSAPASPSAHRFAILLNLALALGAAVACSSSDPGASEGMAGTPSVAGSAGAAQAGMSDGHAGGAGLAGGTSVGGGSGAGATTAEAGSAGAAQGGQPAGGASNAGAGGAGTAGASGNSNMPAVHYVGRVDTSNGSSARFAWSGTGAIVRFNGTAASVDLAGGQEYTVVVDGKVQPKLTAANGVNKLAEGLTAGEHSVELYRRTEANQGESEIRGFDLKGGELLPPKPVTRRLEFIGDSITCGYGNEGASATCGFTPQTENHYLSYAAIAARNLQAEVSTIAWSGKGVVCNYGDDASSCMDPLPTYYDRALPDRADSVWDFARFQADAVVVNLGTNDLSTSSDPDQTTFENAYKALLQRVRKAYPNARILCTNGPMLSGTDLTTVRKYIADVVTAMADPKITAFEIEPQDGSDAYGCDYHPSLERHKKVATVVTAALKAALNW